MDTWKLWRKKNANLSTLSNYQQNREWNVHLKSDYLKMQLSYRTETTPLVSVYSYDNRHRHFVSSSMTTEWLMTLTRSGRERGIMVENEMFNNHSPLNCLEVKLLNYYFTIVVISKKKVMTSGGVRVIF